jgi:KDO2-lipid IV(A) lauroyltransferase
MDWLLYLLARGLIRTLQALPLKFVARLGRWCGGLAYRLDGRHRRVAQENLALCFSKEKSLREIKALACENFKRIGESFACAVKTADMTFEELSPHVEFVGASGLLAPKPGQIPQGVVAAIGHFGNFELYARFGQFCPAFKCATTYRGLRQPSLNRLLQGMREKSGCLFFERRFDATPLRNYMNQPAIMLGLLADQHAGDGGIWLPFFGHDCSTSVAPAVFALRYNCALFTGICYRVGLARWRIEAGAEIPVRVDGQARPTAEIMLEVNQAFEAAVRRDPANWFWVHRRWKRKKRSATLQTRQPTLEPPAA